MASRPAIQETAAGVGQRDGYPPYVGQPGTEPVTTTDGASFLKLKAWVKDSLTKHSDWYKEARECFDMVAGRQWSEEDKKALNEDGRVPVEFNRIGTIVDSICGMEVNNRQEIKFLPRTMGDAEADEKLSSLGQWARDEAQSEDEESDAFRDATICGRGWTETRLDFEEEPTGKLADDRIDPLEAGADPSAVKANFLDGRYLWRYRDFDSNEAMVRFPGLMPQAIDAAWARQITPIDGGEGNKRDYPDETRDALKTDDIAPKTCRVVMIQWWERVTTYMVAAPGMTEPVEMPEDKFKEQEDALTAAGVKSAKIVRRQYKQAFLGRASILEQDDIDGFTLAAITGKRDRNKGYHYGVVRAMRDPQRLANATLSNVLHIIKTNAKGGIITEKGAFANARDAEKDWSNPAKSIVVNDGYIEKIKNREAPQIPAALPMLQEFSISSIRDVTGVSVELLGMADRDQAASLEYQRRQSGMTILAPLFDSLRRFRKTKGRILISQLRKLPPGVLVRVIADDAVPQQGPDGQPMQPGQPGPDGQPQQPKPQFMPFDADAFGLSDKAARFDVIVDEAPTSPNQKEAAWATIQPMLAGMAGNPRAIQVALKYSPLPTAAAKEFADAFAGPQLPPEVQQMIEAGRQQIQQLTQENEALKADHSVAQGKLSIDAFNADTKRRAEESKAMLEALGHINTRLDTMAQMQGGNNGTQ